MIVWTYILPCRMHVMALLLVMNKLASTTRALWMTMGYAHRGKESSRHYTKVWSPLSSCLAGRVTTGAAAAWQPISGKSTPLISFYSWDILSTAARSWSHGRCTSVQPSMRTSNKRWRLLLEYHPSWRHPLWEKSVQQEK